MSVPPAEKVDKRQHLLDVAETLFAQHGYEAVSIRQLASEAGVNIAMVSYYFGSKDKLFEALIASKIPRTTESLVQLADSDISPWEKLSRVIDIYIEKFFSKRSFHKVVMREISLQQRPENVQLITSYLSHNMELIKGFIVEGQEKGMFRYVDPEMTIATLFGALTQVVNNTTLMCSLLKEGKEDNLLTDAYRIRFTIHIKAMIQAHLMLPR